MGNFGRFLLRFALASCVLAVLFFHPREAFSHPGGVDAKGGHRNKKTNIYHFHFKHLKKKKKAKKTDTTKPLAPASVPKIKLPKVSTPKMDVQSSNKKMTEKEPVPFAIFDQLEAERKADEKLANDQSDEKSDANVEQISYQVLKTERANNRVTTYILLVTDDNDLPSEELLQNLSYKLDSGNRFLIYYFLDGMSTKSSPWAVAKKDAKSGLSIKCFKKRAPKQYQTANKMIETPSVKMKPSGK